MLLKSDTSAAIENSNDKNPRVFRFHLKAFKLDLQWQKELTQPSCHIDPAAAGWGFSFFTSKKWKHELILEEMKPLSKLKPGPFSSSLLLQNNSIMNQASGRCLEVVPAKVYFGHLLVLQSCSGQRWTIKNTMKQ